MILSDLSGVYLNFNVFAAFHLLEELKLLIDRSRDFQADSHRQPINVFAWESLKNQS
jgi:hypothetical protein